MALTLKHPVEVWTILLDLDPTGEAKIAFRQATARENQIRDQLIFSPQRRSFTDEGMEIRDAMAWSIRQEIECRLTMCGAEGLIGPDDKPLFRFKKIGSQGAIAMSDDEFHTAWGKIWPISICDRFHGLCLDANPEWDFRPKVAGEPNPPPAEESETG